MTIYPHKSLIKRPVAFLLTILLLTLPVVSADNSVTSSAATKLTLSASSVTMRVGKQKTVKLTGSFASFKTTASKAGIVLILSDANKIRIRGLKKGSVKIKVDGYNKNNKLKVSKTITVKVKKSLVDISDEYSIDRIHTGEATYYDLGDEEGSAYLNSFAENNGYLTAAMQAEDFLQGMAGAYIEVTDKDGDVVNVLVTDLLPAGMKGDIDLTREAFKSIEPLVTGRMDISWRIIPLPTIDPVKFVWKSGSSKYWAQIQVRNHRYPIRSLEYLDTTDDTFKELTRECYNYFTAPDGLGCDGPYTFRITDFYGRSIIEEDIPMKSGGKVIRGKDNFPIIEEETGVH